MRVAFLVAATTGHEAGQKNNPLKGKTLSRSMCVPERQLEVQALPRSCPLETNSSLLPPAALGQVN